MVKLFREKDLKLPKGAVQIGYIDVSDEVLMKAIVNELGIGNVPSRPHLRRSIDKHKREIVSFAKKTLGRYIDGEFGQVTALDKIGKFVEKLVRGEIDTANTWAKPLAAATVARKKTNTILKETGEMYDSIKHEVKD